MLGRTKKGGTAEVRCVAAPRGGAARCWTLRKAQPVHATKSAFALLAGLAMIVSAIADITEHVAAILQVAVAVTPMLVMEVRLLDIGHPLVVLMLFVWGLLTLLPRLGGPAPMA